MEFCKPGFLAFFAVVFAVYWRLPAHGLRMGWLLLASAVYYATFNIWFLPLMLLSTGIDYVVAVRMPAATPARRRFMLVLSIAVNLGILAFFKYALFAATVTADAASWFGFSVHSPTWKLLLPLGISFYTFEAISYVVDVYRGKIKPLTSPRDYLLYIMFFPHLLAGPIVRTGDFVHQLHAAKRFSWLRLEVGVRLFVLGLFKKAILADWVAAVVDPVFAAPGTFSTASLWLATLGYAVQIYGDFSGYSDMAIGLAHMLGFKLPANFRTPYLSADISEFWRRWHISLSSWLRDYLFIPLGGSRGGQYLTCRNLMLTMALGGLWHGAGWTFICWGVYHGMLLVAHRLIPVPTALKHAAFRPVWVAATFLSVVLGWVLFRATTFADAATVLRGLFVPTAGTALETWQANWVLASLAVIFVGGIFGNVVDLRKLQDRLPVPVAAAGLAGAVLAYLLLLPMKAGGFIYFQF